MATANRYRIGFVGGVYGYMTQQGIALTEVPAQSYTTRISGESRQRMDDWLESGSMSNLWLAPDVDGLILQHNNPTDCPDMALASFPSQPSDFALCYPPAYGGKAFLHAFDARASHATDITSSSLLPASPCFAALFVRAPQCPSGMAVTAQLWRLTFGGGYTLEFSRTAPARLLDTDGTTVLGKRLKDDPKNDAYSLATTISFTIYNLLGNLYIYSSAWSGAWIIRNVGALPAASFRVRGAGGTYAFNVAALTFQTSGYVITDEIEHFYSFDPGGLVGDCQPAAPAGSAATVAISSATGTKKKYLVTLTGDGRHTPVVQCVRARYLPTMAAPDADPWLADITPWVREASAELRSGWHAREVKLTLIPQKIVDGQTLWQYLAATLGVSELRGSYALSAEVGTAADNRQPLLTGTVDITGDAMQCGELGTIQLTAVDRWALLNSAGMFCPPCCGGMLLVDAVTLICQWHGIAAGDIEVEADSGIADMRLNSATNLWETPPVDDWSKPPYLPAQGSKGGEFIKSMAEPFGVRVYCTPSGTIRLERAYDPSRTPTPAATYSARNSADLAQAVTSLELESDRTGLVNWVVAQGLDPSGKPLWAARYDADSIVTPDTDRHLGHVALQFESLPDISAQDRLEEAARAKFNQRGGHPGRRITSDEPTCELWRRLPETAVTLLRTDHDGDDVSELVDLTGVSLDLKPERNTGTLTGEVRPYGA